MQQQPQPQLYDLSNGRKTSCITFVVGEANQAAPFFKGIPGNMYIDICLSNQQALDFLPAFLAIREDECLEALLSMGVYIFVGETADREVAGKLLSHLIKLQRNFYASSSVESHKSHVSLRKDDGKIFEHMAKTETILLCGSRPMGQEHANIYSYRRESALRKVEEHIEGLLSCRKHLASNDCHETREEVEFHLEQLDEASIKLAARSLDFFLPDMEWFIETPPQEFYDEFQRISTARISGISSGRSFEDIFGSFQALVTKVEDHYSWQRHPSP